MLWFLCFVLLVVGLPSPAIVAGQASTPVVVFDSFTDTAGIDLEDHTGELGASWAPHPSYNAGIDITPNGTVYNGTNTKVYLASGIPPSAEYDVEADLIILTNQDHGGIVGRANPNSDTYYAAEGSAAQDIWQLRKRVNGSWTLLKFVDMDFEPGRTYRLRLELRNGSQKFYVDDELILEDDDNDPALRQAGRAGIRLSSDSFHPGDPTRGWQIDNFRVTAAGPADTTPPAAPANLTAQTDPEGVVINLDWDDNTDFDLAGYDVYRSSQAVGPFSRINAGLLTSSPFVDLSAPGGATSYYRVVAVDLSDNVSEPSNVASATRPVDVTPPAPPANLSATGMFTGIDLDWDANSELDVTGYRIYRSSQAGGPYALIDQIGKTSSYLDTDLAPGETAYYRVSAVDSSDNESDLSAEASATMIEATFDLLVSMSPNRSNPVPLDGATVAGDIYAFTSPDLPEITRVRFFFNDPSMDGSPTRVENGAPYDFAGGTVNTASPFDTESLPDGAYSLTAAIDLDDGSVQVAHATFTIDNGAPPPVATPVPATIQAEDYDLGGEGVAYHDTTSGNSGGKYRSDDVDIQTTSDAGAGYNVGWVRTGEWLNYTLNIPHAGEYTVTLRLATQYSNRNLHLEIDGDDISGPVTATNTGGTQKWADVSTPVQLPAGIHTLTIAFEGDNINFNYFTITANEPPPPPPPPPAAPQNLVADLAPDGITINLDWDDNDEPDLAGYRIYRSDQSGGPFTLLAEIGTDSAYADGTAPAGMTVYYHVTAFNETGDASDPSNEASATRPEDTTPPASPTGLSATGTFDGIDLDWADNTESDLAGYRIYRSEQSGGPYTLIDEVGTTSSYADTTVEAGVVFYYQLTAVDTTGNESAPSAEAIAERLVDTSPPAAPSGLVATGTFAAINLDWADNTENDLAGYRIYRSSQPGGPFALLDEIGPVSSYSDDSIAAGATAYYQVTALDTAGNESAPSSEVSAIRPESAFVLMVSMSSNRSNPVPLEGQVVSGNIYVFTTPDAPNIQRVRFYLNNPAMSGNPYRIENSAPYDLGGGSVTFASPFSTTILSNGVNTITAAIELSGGAGTEVVHAEFIVDNS